jgi:DNA adenine methylase
MHFDTTARAKPVLKWAGGKGGLLEQLVPYFPVQFGRYLEPFLGGAAVFLSLKPTVPAVLNELNEEIFNLYSAIRSQPLELISRLEEYRSRYSKDFYYELRAKQPLCPVTRAARTLFLNKTGFNGLYRQNKKGEFNVPFGHYKSCPAVYSSDNILLVSERLANATLMNSDFSILLSQAGEGDFVYCDPPYEPLTPTSSFNSYTGAGFSRADQVRLKNECSAAVERGAVVAVSNSSAQFIRELYSESTLQTVRARRAINSNPTKRGAIEELLILMHKDF